MPYDFARAAPSSGASVPRVWAPSESSRIAEGGASGSTGGGGGGGVADGAPSLSVAESGCSSSTERASASPIAVPRPNAVPNCSDSSTSSRSCVSGDATNGSDENVTSPTRYLSGTWSRKRLIASCAATSRVGLMSSACIEPETSTVSAIDACSLATVRSISGRASAATAKISASAASAGGR